MPKSTWQSEAHSLVDAGHADSFADAKTLRNEIIQDGETVAKWLKAKAQTASQDDAVPHNSDMLEITSLMRATGGQYAEAKLLRDQIIKDGRTVREFMLADAQHGAYGLPTTTELFKAAGELIELVGDDAERAVEAIKAYAAVHQPGQG